MGKTEPLLTDERFMQRALQLARKGEGRVSPNPMVGAVIVRNGRIIGEGFHRRCGGNHAEINAIAAAGDKVAGATFYITLEPCSHFGRTPPCVDALLARHPARVVIGTADPNPLVAGRGIAALRKAGIAVATGVLAEECRRLNEVFFKYIQTGLPFVTLKFAQTLDGRIATAAGHSRWISSPASLTFSHRLRRTHDAILVGSQTVLNDDPELTCRLVRGKNPLRIVVDSRLRTSPAARVYQATAGARTIVATTRGSDKKKRRLFEAQGVEVLEVRRDRAGHVNLRELLALLGKREISSLLVEGGATVATSVLQERLADRLIVILAPKIVGKGVAAVGDLGIRRMDEALRFRIQRVHRRGDDLILDGRIAPEMQQDVPPPGCRPGQN